MSYALIKDRVYVAKRVLDHHPAFGLTAEPGWLYVEVDTDEGERAYWVLEEWVSDDRSDLDALLALDALAAKHYPPIPSPF